MKIVLPTATVDLDTLEIRGPHGPDAERLSAQEADMLRFLAARPGEVVTRRTLLTEVLGYAPTVSTRAVDHAVSRLRRKLEPDPRAPRSLRTVYGRGLMLEVLQATHSTHEGLLGRSDALARLQGLVEREGVALVVGPAGVGKSTLARQLGRDGALRWVDLSACRTPSELMSTMLAAAGASGAGDRSRELAVAVEALCADTTLVVLDNLEQLEPDAVALVAGFVQGASVPVVLTSRGSPLELPRVRLGGLDTDDGVALLQASARRAAPMAPIPDSVASLRALCEAVDGLPLALELLGAQLPFARAPELVERLDDYLEVGDGRRGRHESLSAAIRHSWDSVSPEARVAAARWSLWTEPIPVDTAGALLHEGAPPAARLASELLRAGLLRPVGGRIVLWESVRAFGRARLRATGDWDAAVSAQVDVLVARAPVALRWSWPTQRAVLGSMNEYLAAMRRLPDTDERAVSLGICLLLVKRCLSRTLVEEVWTRVQVMLSGVPTELRVLAELLGRDIGHREDATLARIASTAIDAGRTDVASEAMRLRCNHARRRGEHPHARHFLDEAAALAEQAGGTQVAWVVYERAVQDRAEQHLEAAHDGLVRCLAMARSDGDRLLEAGAAMSLAAVARRRRDAEATFAALHAGREVALRCEDDRLLAAIANNQVHALLTFRPHERDAQWAASREALACSRRSGQLVALCHALGTRGALHHLDGDLLEAEVAYRQARQVAERLDAVPLVHLWTFEATLMAHLAGRTDAAAVAYDDLVAQRPSDFPPGVWSRARAAHAVLLCELGRADEAARAVEEAEREAGPADAAYLALCRRAIDGGAGVRREPHPDDVTLLGPYQLAQRVG